MTNVYKNVAFFLNAFLQSKSKNLTKMNVTNFKLFHNTTNSISLFIFRLAKNWNGPGRAEHITGRAGLEKIHGKTGRAGPQVGRAGPGLQNQARADL